ncbi:hypothetical protein IQ227_20680 [Anabaena aphanizomenioides LEGE 00250]|uniref:HicB-like antitoxin of toxin-antitoxin system domain-containing protein n=1 Tax=Sphaerospermopsis aphanizomenoides LEGE 00250 TaxID=2777972 RepID=A0ABR9VJH1_9CYAN|nr:hypothetical protein [Sphaerospermopsis aphanizomenoides]MBE9238370.1 hypothetical protein [Sphaerospermopsis aphanizomenoides LEGE 00250]
MILDIKQSASQSSLKIAPKSTYDLLIENQTDGTVKATLLSLPECQGVGNTETEAIEALDKILQVRLGNAKIVTLEIAAPKTENPWMKIAGKYKDDPQFDQMLEYIEEYRRELDAINE